MNDDEALYYLRAWSFLKGALPILLPLMRSGQLNQQECANDIECIVTDAEAFALNPRLGLKEKP